MEETSQDQCMIAHIKTPDDGGKLKKTVFFVEANSFERLKLWQDNKNSDEPLSWVEELQGFVINVGEIISNGNILPVNVEFFFATINGKFIAFYSPISRGVDYDMVEQFIIKNYPVKYDNLSRQAMCDAMNFHTCMHFCKNNTL